MTVPRDKPIARGTEAGLRSAKPLNPGTPMTTETTYPSGPADAPADLTAPTPAFKRHAWLAMGGLLVFIAAYFGLLAWLGLTAWHQGSELFSGESANPLAAGLVMGCSAFLAVFMAKPLFSIQRHAHPDDIELTPANQPVLFDFLHRLADEAKAPRPTRVYVSPRVNASVFYDISILNLVFPSKKNLEIGLALVNVLNLGEFKAVLAHEFGHFAQRSMAVGRWVYMAQQIASHVVAQRGKLDDFVSGLSRVDLRIAWIGWLLGLVIWSIRSIVELMFRLVVLAQRALSREMEYQADLVATALTGSDALVHALHKLGAADEAWQRALAFANSELGEKRTVADLFAVQTRIIDHLRRVQADPEFGKAPTLPADATSFRVFKDSLAKPPSMWSTHPDNTDREANVKRRYVAAAIDTRPAWVLFSEPETLRREVTQHLFAEAVKGRELDVPTVETSLQELDSQFKAPSLDRRYRGSYLSRSLTRHAVAVDALIAPVPPDADLRRMHEELYSDAHDRDLDRERALGPERETMQGLIDGTLKAPGRLVRWRGQEYKRDELPRIKAQIDADLAEINDSLHAHDRTCRGVHIAMANRLDPAHADHLRGVLALLHYAEHVHADLMDAHGVLGHTFDVVTADRNVSAAELQRLCKDANQVQSVLAAIHGGASSIELDSAVAARLKATSWSTLLGDLGLPPATKDNIDPWIKAVDGWVRAYGGCLRDLQEACRDTLLAGETVVSNSFLSNAELPPSPGTSTVPPAFNRLIPGQERKRELKLSLWDRFQSADGVVASTAKFAVAGGILGSVLWAATGAGQQHVTIHNGFGRPVTASIDGARYLVAPLGQVRAGIDRLPEHEFAAQSEDGKEIERFIVPKDDVSGETVYNIASAVPLVIWTSSYGTAAEVAPRQLGNPRVFKAHADHLFEAPPDSIQTQGSGGTRTALMSLGGWQVSDQLAQVDESARSALITTHLLWEPADSEALGQWLDAATERPDATAILARRLALFPDDVQTHRNLQGFGTPEEQDRECAATRSRSAAAMENADLLYLAIRCDGDDPMQNQRFDDALARFPDHPWLMMATAAGLSESGQWRDARDRYLKAATVLPATRQYTHLEAYRMMRILGEGNSAPARDLAQQQPFVGILQRMDAGTPTEGHLWSIAPAFLVKGDLARALDAVADAERADMIALVAASDGASEEQIEAGLTLGTDSALSPYASMALFGLATREQRGEAAWRDRAFSALPAADQRQIAAFISMLGTPDSAEAAFESLNVESRGMAFVYAAVVLGDACPPSWRENAKAMLFAAQRPYLGTSSAG